MRATEVLQKCLGDALKPMHALRRHVLLRAVEALIHGRRLTLIDVARAWPGAERIRAPLKALDRLLGNPHLHAEREHEHEHVHAAMARWLLRGPHPVVVLDWCDLKADRRWHLLRAAVPVGGRTLTILDMVWLRGKQTIYVDSEKRHRNVRLLDFENQPGSNVFQVTWEWAYRNGTRKGNRADVVFVINGVPVAIVENKNPKSKDAMSKALVQLRRYELETPEMLTAPQVFNITHLIEYFYGVTWNTQRKFVFNWKEEKAGSYEDRVKHFFDHTRFLRMLRDWILFFEQDDELRKTVLRQHQTRAAIKVDAVARFVAQHFRENVEPLGYKAFLVGVDREACALYKQALDTYLPPDYSVPVYTASAAGRQKPNGLIIDFIGMLRDLNKALAFDSQDVSGVIEDLDLLLVEFRRLLAEAQTRYLTPLAGGKDKQLETLLYDVFLAPEARQEFIDSYRQIESLYEILSPSAELRPHVQAYGELTDLYLMVRNAYGGPTHFYEDVARKTEQMVRQSAISERPISAGKAVEFDLKTLLALRAEGGNDNATVINLVRAIEREAEDRADEQPVLLDIAQRTQVILEALEQRTLSTQEAIDQLGRLIDEREQSDAAREKLGLDPATFAIYWHLQGDGIGDALSMASEIMAAASKYPNHRENDDERRQLKSEIYRSLVTRGVDGAQMVRLGDAVLRMLRG